jgi:pSer/pThr/pTyr-binding forkhead associated (FHA) protein
MKKDSPLLHITDPDGKIHDHLLTDEEVTIGRGDNNVLVFFDPKVSRNHAKIEKKGKNYFVTDLGSFNGTRINQEIIKSVELKHGDEIRVGKASLVFQTQKGIVSSREEKQSFAKDDEYKEWQHQTIAISSQDCTNIDSRTLLITPKTKPRSKDRSIPILSHKEKPQEKDQVEISRLERMNKVLFVLYEISRHMNIIHDFNELLQKIMDLIFMVIDADCGFLILIDETAKGDFIPVVDKFKDDRKKGKIRASRTLCKKVVDDRVALLTSNAMADARFSPTESLVKQKIRSGRRKTAEPVGEISLSPSCRHDPKNRRRIEGRFVRGKGCERHYSFHRHRRIHQAF